MKGKIDKTGNLHIWRGKAWKLQDCPHGDTCGDHCACFDEPLFSTNNDGDKIVFLDVCATTHEFNDFTDERGKE